eukprot:TRINITY_DN2039_c0_g1_i1.p1 TRINITY_DN2039_c0_g1~~TRINITY_DN2039_c0_g1_i1.p1  ORF type:complete len:379 (+),score=65.96 TRINITY_DN2039_c0_g1_i1:145-1137(+)
MTVLSKEFFDISTQVIKSLVENVPNTTADNFNGIMWAQGVPVPWSAVSICLGEKSPVRNTPTCRGFNYAIEAMVNPSRTASQLLITLDFDPLGSWGQSWLATARSQIASATAGTDVTVYLSGINADSLDAITAVFDNFPLIVTITSVIVLVFVAVAFRSVLIPLRAILTIGLTIVWVFGFCNLTYDNGLLNFVHFAGLQGVGAVVWGVPVISFSIIVGIGLDYDIFLLVRTREFRLKGYSSMDSIILGLYKTGGIITAAGVIMAVAFSGLLLSNIPLLNQLAFDLIFAVLFDTFVVRTILVPAIMGIVGDWSWWPGTVPPVSLKINMDSL